MEGGVPPLGVPGPVDGEPLLELLLLRRLAVILRAGWSWESVVINYQACLTPIE